MPKEFNDCVANGGKVRTKSLPGGKYMHFCIKDGKTIAGEVKMKQKTPSRSKVRSEIRKEYGS